MGNIILDNSLGLNLYITPIAYRIIIISNDQEEVRKRFLVESWSIFRLETIEYLLSFIPRLMLRSKNINLVFSLFSFSFYFPFNLFFIFQFLELWG